MREPIANDLLEILESKGATLREVAWHADGTAKAVMATVNGRVLVEVRDWVPASQVGVLDRGRVGLPENGSPYSPAFDRAVVDLLTNRPSPSEPEPAASVPVPTPTPPDRSPAMPTPKPIKNPRKSDVAKALHRLLVDHVHGYIEGVARITVVDHEVTFDVGKVHFTITVSIPRKEVPAPPSTTPKSADTAAETTPKTETT